MSIELEAFLLGLDPAVAELPEKLKIVEGPDESGKERIVEIHVSKTCYIGADRVDHFPHGPLVKGLRAIALKHQAELYCFPDGGFRFVKRE